MKPRRSRSPASSRTPCAGSWRTRTTSFEDEESHPARRRRGVGRSGREPLSAAVRAPRAAASAVARRGVRSASPASRAPVSQVQPRTRAGGDHASRGRAGDVRRHDRRPSPARGGCDVSLRARMHIYQSAPGTTLPHMLRSDRPMGGRGHTAVRQAHPLTPAAAGLLFREPRWASRRRRATCVRASVSRWANGSTCWSRSGQRRQSPYRWRPCSARKPRPRLAAPGLASTCVGGG